MTRVSYLVKGIVQGVGFRPFVYQLATKLELKGFVKNTPSGVEIELEGDEEKIKEFERVFFEELPPLSRVDEFSKKRLKPLCHERFWIEESSISSEKKVALIPPDIKTCKKCLEDILDLSPIKKYYNYFATNCTNCGARYSIIQTVPYDRKNTSMNKFVMCDSCKEEYENPLSRRYHAQPIACNKCGPKLNFDDFSEIALWIKSGKIGAIKGIGGFHIVCDASNDEALRKLRVYKNRPTKPFALMCKDIKQIKTFAKVTSKEEKMLESKEAPIVLLESKTKLEVIAPNIDRVGCMLPYTPLHFLLFKHLDNPIVATSANLGGEPIITDEKELKEKLPFLEFVVEYDRDIVNAIDDSVVQVVDDKLQILRLARGYAPRVLSLPRKIDKKILAVGANQKSTISIAFDKTLILSPYIADLDSIKSLDYFHRTIETFKRFYDFKPDIVVADKHPNYESTKWAKKYDPIMIQHHKAHLAAVKAEFGLSGDDFTGFIFDGTGLGDDGSLWGGEVFVSGKREYHFKPIKLIGGEKAIKEPYRVALSLLFEKYSLEELKKIKFSFKNMEFLYRAWKKGLNSPLSSSVGRLFDGVSALAGLCKVQTYEGEAGLLTEAKVKELDIKRAFDFTLDGGVIEIEWDFFAKDLVERFYATLVSIMIEIAKKESKPVLLSGGVFQNKTLLEFVIREFKKEGIEFYYNQTLPINDSGISVGQVWESLEDDF